MRYVIAIATFVIMLPVTIVMFSELAPEAYFEWLRRLSWGRELGGIIMFTMPVAAGLLAFHLAS
jgi:hypothetical protein